MPVVKVYGFNSKQSAKCSRLTNDAEVTHQLAVISTFRILYSRTHTAYIRANIIMTATLPSIIHMEPIKILKLYLAPTLGEDACLIWIGVYPSPGSNTKRLNPRVRARSTRPVEMRAVFMKIDSKRGFLERKTQSSALVLTLSSQFIPVYSPRNSTGCLVLTRY